jgi:D-serine deaminase-like pyridoxal phosphate-dependent protein
VKTPFLRYRSRMIQESLNSVVAKLIASDKTSGDKSWAPLLSGQIPMSVLSLISQVTSQASVRSADKAATLAAAGFRSFVLTRPVVDAESLRTLSILTQDCDVCSTIDHFRHAELLSQTLVAEDRTVSILLDVDTGHSLTGVRPGPDSVRLATAVTQLPGLQLAGVIVDESTFAKSFPLSDHGRVLADAVAVAKHCQRMIEASGLTCKELTAGIDHFAAALTDPDVTRVLTSPFKTDGTVTSQSGLDKQRPALSLVGRVISRPSLEWCVIDIGTGLIEQAFHTQVSHPAGVLLLKAHRDISSLQLSGESLDLRIGDEIEFALNAVPEGFHLPCVVED